PRVSNPLRSLVWRSSRRKSQALLRSRNPGSQGAMALDRSGLIALALLCLIVAGSTGLPAAAAKAVDPAEILAKAEEVRSPNLDYAVDFEISVLDNYTPG